MQSWIDDNRELLIQTSDYIWANPEMGLHEFKSSQKLQDLLSSNGFEFQTGFSGMKTAFCATWGKGKPVIGFLGEFDCLPGLSQKACSHEEPVESGAPGHGGGHNLLGTAAAGAAIDLKNRMERENLTGTLQFWGCPDEEFGFGKTYMTRDGAFNNLDVALTMHPAIANFVNEGIQTSVFVVDFEFFGKAAHAAKAPWDGRSALDAVELMLTGLNYLHEHVTKDVLIHYVITNGGEKPNVVPKYASCQVMFRGAIIQKTKDTFGRILKIAEGAALMTETSYKHGVKSAFYSFNVNEALAKVAHDAMTELAPIDWTESELQFAKELQARYAPETIRASIRNYCTDAALPTLENVVLHSGVVPYLGKPFNTNGSTDVSDVSWVVPALEICTACRPVGLAPHTWEQTACAGMSIGHKGMLYAAKAMSLTGYKLLTQPETLQKVKSSFEDSTRDFKYEPILPKDKMP